MPGLASADPHTLSTLSISRTNGQQRSNGIISPSRNMDQVHTSEQSQVDHRTELHRKEFLPHFDARAAEESLSLYCKPIELYNIIQRRALRNPIFLQRCLSYKMEEARQRRMKLTISVVKVSTTLCDTQLTTGKPNGRCFGLGNVPQEQVFQSVLVMLTTPVSTSGMGYSCFRLSQTRVLRSTSANMSSAENKGQPSVTFLLPEIRKLLVNAKRDGAVIVFITSGDLNPTCSGKGTRIESSVNSSGSVLWGSISLTTLYQNWLDPSGDGGHANGTIPEMSDHTLHLDLYPSRLQLVNSLDGRYVNFQSTPYTSSAAKSMARLQLSLLGEEVGRSTNKFRSASGSLFNYGRVSNCPSISQARRLQPGQVVFHYHYYCNQLYKSEVTENYSCPFCVRCCSSLKGLRCHLNSTHDLFTFEFLATADYRLVNVFCRNDVLDPEGNVRDIDGLNDPRLKNFVYWSKCGRPRKASVAATLRVGSHHFEGQLTPGLEKGNAGLQECLPKDPSSSAHLVFPLTPKSRPFSPELRLSKDGPLPQGLEKSSECQVVKNDPANITTSVPCIEESADIPANASSMQEQPRKHERSEDQRKLLKVADQTFQAFKKQRPEIDDSKPLSPVGHSFVGMAPNGVCLAIAAPMPAEKRSVQSTVNTQVTSFRSRVDKHQRTLIERSEARIRSQLQKRQFFHSHTAQPMALEQLLSDRDSEDENDDAVMDLEDRRMLDDFVDVTQDEKELMHLWNSFVCTQRVLADGHCPWACEAFTKLHAKKFYGSPALRRCLMLFLIKLWNHNLVDGNTINRCLLIIDLFEETTEKKVSNSNLKA